MDINLHKVKEIKMSKTRQVSDFYVRDIIFHNEEFNTETGDMITVENKITLFLNGKEAGKVKYAKT